MRLGKPVYRGSVPGSTSSMMKRSSNIYITMKRVLSHDKTNADLADYLAMKVLTYNTDSSKHVITSSSGYTKSNDSIE